MADRTSAYLFSTIFQLIEDYVPHPERHEVAKRYWKEASGYDFSNSQLECDELLMRLGLAQTGVDPRYPEDGETTIYFGDRGWRTEAAQPKEKNQ